MRRETLHPASGWRFGGRRQADVGSHPSLSPCRTLAVTRIASEDEAIYQCIAENSAGTNQASARLAISQGPELPEAPAGLQAAALGEGSLQLTWEQPTERVSQQIIGYVLHIRRLGGKEPRG